MEIPKHITFYYSNAVEKQTALPVAAEAERRGYQVRFTENPFEKSDVGVFCAHDSFPGNARLSIVILHDMGQEQLNWPNIWRNESWNGFDVGILPGDNWAERWQQRCAHRFARPKRGVFKLGWPKSDDILAAGDGTLSAAATALRQELNLRHHVFVLYAPLWENYGKQDEFVRVLRDLPVILLLKQFPWTDEWPGTVSNVAEMNALHADIAPNVHIIDPQTSIMHAIELCN